MLQHQIHLSIAIKSSSYFRVFWLSLYIPSKRKNLFRVLIKENKACYKVINNTYLISQSVVGKNAKEAYLKLVKKKDTQCNLHLIEVQNRQIIEQIRNLIST